MRGRVYLDYAAATPLDKNVAKAMHDVEHVIANPSSQYTSSREANNYLSLARKQIAMFFGANTEEIIFTSSATESNNLAILGAVKAEKKGHIISIATEHSSVREPLNYLALQGYEIDWCNVDKHGRIDKQDLERKLCYDTKLVTISYANSEIGTTQQISKISAIIKNHERSNGTKVIFHSDASAAVQTLNCDVSRLGVDLLTVGGAKIYGPKGIGALYVKRGTQLDPIIYGGKQENGLRSGSENISLVVGMAQALSNVNKERKKYASYYRELYTNLIHDISQEHKVIENGHPKERIFSVASICIDGANGADLVAYLDASGFEVSTGAACEATNNMPSHALLAVGRSKAQAQGSLRISFGKSTKHKDIDEFCKILKKTLNTLV